MLEQIHTALGKKNTLHLKVDFPSGPSEKTGYRNIFLLRGRRDRKHCVCWCSGAFPFLIVEVVFLNRYMLEVTCTGLPQIWNYQRLLETFPETKGSYSNSSCGRCSL